MSLDDMTGGFSATLAQAKEGLAAAVPNILLAAVVLIVGWGLALALSWLVFRGWRSPLRSYWVASSWALLAPRASEKRVIARYSILCRLGREPERALEVTMLPTPPLRRRASPRVTTWSSWTKPSPGSRSRSPRARWSSSTSTTRSGSGSFHESFPRIGQRRCDLSGRQRSRRGRSVRQRQHSMMR